MASLAFIVNLFQELEGPTEEHSTAGG